MDFVTAKEKGSSGLRPLCYWRSHRQPGLSGMRALFPTLSQRRKKGHQVGHGEGQHSCPKCWLLSWAWTNPGFPVPYWGRYSLCAALIRCPSEGLLPQGPRQDSGAKRSHMYPIPPRPTVGLLWQGQVSLTGPE